MDVKYNRSKNSIKIWPYLDDISQAIIPYSTEHLSKNSDMVINLDFSCVKRVSSSGTVIALSKLMAALSLKKGYTFKFVMPEDLYIESFLQNIGFFSTLSENIRLEQASLFETNYINHDLVEFVSYDKSQNVKKVSFPIFQLKYDKYNDRESVDLFADKVTDVILENLPQFKYNNILLSVIKEIAKNSHDHTENDSYFGIDIIKNLELDSGELFFSFTDFGPGITKNVKKHLANNTLLTRAKDKFSYTDAYHFAFTLGNTTSNKTRNKGVGMSMIRDGACMLNLDLSIWDGRSMLFIPTDISHAELRKNAFDTGNPVGFYYYGRLKF